NDGSLNLAAVDATTHGSVIRLEKSGSMDNLGWWTNKDDFASWDVDLPSTEARQYTVSITYACHPDSAGATYEISIDADSTRVGGAVTATANWADFKTEQLGALRLHPGRQTISIHATSIPNGAVMNLAQIRLVPKRESQARGD